LGSFSGKPAMPTGLCGTGAVALGIYFFVFGGADSTATPQASTLRYDAPSLTGVWTSMKPMPTARSFVAAVIQSSGV
jgi:hypothetical protein